MFRVCKKEYSHALTVILCITVLFALLKAGDLQAKQSVGIIYDLKGKVFVGADAAKKKPAYIFQQLYVNDVIAGLTNGKCWLRFHY